MIYRLRFHELALSEWRKLDGSGRAAFKHKLEERLQHPRIPRAALAGMPDCYKIKLRKAGFRLVYKVEDDIVFVTVISIGKREREAVHTEAKRRLEDE